MDRDRKSGGRSRKSKENWWIEAVASTVHRGNLEFLKSRQEDSKAPLLYSLVYKFLDVNQEKSTHSSKVF